jgi:hypothetical protein
MTEIDWGKLAEPFPADEVKLRPGAATWDHKESCQKSRCRETRDASKHIQFSYVDARAVAQRLDDVVTPAGWDFSITPLPGDVVQGKLVVGGIVREDVGYPNSDADDEPLKSATSDALKRCAVLFGIGRHLYDDNKNGHRPAQNGSGRPAPARLAPVAIQRPVAVPDDPYPANLDADGFTPIDDTIVDNLVCAEHRLPWRGEPGDLYHKKAEGGYCRHPDNVQKPARAR